MTETREAEVQAVGPRGRWYVSPRGFIAAVCAVVNRYIYRSEAVVIVRATLAGPPPADHIDDIVFRRATAADLNRLEELDRYGRGSIQRAYVQNDNDWLFVACHGDRIVAVRRYSTRVRDPRVSRVVALRPGQVWSADIFALPEYRSQGIGRSLAVFADRYMASRNYTELLGAISASNEPSIRLSLGKGTELLHYVSYKRLFGYERVRVSKSSLNRLEARLKAKRSGASRLTSRDHDSLSATGG